MADSKWERIVKKIRRSSQSYGQTVERTLTLVTFLRASDGGHPITVFPARLFACEILPMKQRRRLYTPARISDVRIHMVAILQLTASRISAMLSWDRCNQHRPSRTVWINRICDVNENSHGDGLAVFYASTSWHFNLHKSFSMKKLRNNWQCSNNDAICAST